MPVAPLARRDCAPGLGGCQRYPRRILTTYSPHAPMTSRRGATEAGSGSGALDADRSLGALGSATSSTMPPMALGDGNGVGVDVGMDVGLVVGVAVAVGAGVAWPACLNDR